MAGVPSYDEVLAGLFSLRSSSRPWVNRPGARATLVPGLSSPAEVADHLMHLGFPHIAMTPVNCGPSPAYQWTPEHTDRLVRGYAEYVDLLVERLGQGDLRALAGLADGDVFGRLVLGMCRRSKAQYRCGMARNDLGVGPDGTLYTCAGLWGREEFAVGHVSTGLDRGRAAATRVAPVDERPDCRKCWARHLCGGGCALFALAASGSINGCDAERCDFTRQLAEQAIRFCIELGERSPEALALVMRHARAPLGPTA